MQYVDPFHMVAWATEAFDIVHTQAWNAARGRAKDNQLIHEHTTGISKQLKSTRMAL